jgi:hypothetical protein
MNGHGNGEHSWVRAFVTLGLIFSLLVGCSGGGNSGGPSSSGTASADNASVLFFSDPASSNAALVVTPDGHQLTIQGTKDVQGHLLAITSVLADSIDGDPLHQGNISFDAQSRPVKVVLANGTSMAIDYRSPTEIILSFVAPTGGSLGIISFNPQTNTGTLLASQATEALRTSLLASLAPEYSLHDRSPKSTFVRAQEGAFLAFIGKIMEWISPREAWAQQASNVTGSLDVTCGGAPLADMSPNGILVGTYTPDAQPPTIPGSAVPVNPAFVFLKFTPDGQQPGRFQYDIPLNPFKSPDSTNASEELDSLKSLLNGVCTEAGPFNATNALMTLIQQLIGSQLGVDAAAQATGVFSYMKLVVGQLCASKDTLTTGLQQIQQLQDFFEKLKLSGEVTIRAAYKGEIAPVKKFSVRPAFGPPQPVTIDFPAKACITIQLSAPTYTVARPQPGQKITKTIDVTRTGNKATIDRTISTVSYVTSPGTTGTPAVPGVDFNTAIGGLQFGPTETVKTFPVTILPGNASSRDVTVKLELSISTPDENNAKLGTPNIAILTITDDILGKYFGSGTTVDVCSVSGSDTYPSGAVFIEITSHTGDQFSGTVNNSGGGVVSTLIGTVAKNGTGYTISGTVNDILEPNDISFSGSFSGSITGRTINYHEQSSLTYYINSDPPVVDTCFYDVTFSGSK